MGEYQISVNEIKRDMTAFLRRLEAGESLVILKAGKPLAEVKPVALHPLKTRPFGLCHGDLTVQDDFDAPLPENIIKEFEGK